MKMKIKIILSNITNQKSAYSLAILANMSNLQMIPILLAVKLRKKTKKNEKISNYKQQRIFYDANKTNLIS